MDQNFQTLGGNKYMLNTHMLVGEAYERMGLGKAPRGVASKPLLSLILETLGRIPDEDESFLLGNLEVSVKTVANGRVTEVLVHILDEETLVAPAVNAREEEVQA